MPAAFAPSMADLAARWVALRALYGHDGEAGRYVREGAFYFTLIHLLAACVVAGWLPPWSLPLVLPLCMTRMIIGRHELLHLRDESQVDRFTRLWPMMAMLTPLSAGYREHRQLHQLHHQYMLTEADPELYQIRGGKLRGWLVCMTAPEQTLVRWAQVEGANFLLVRDLFLRALFFYSMVMFTGHLFLWYWLPLRVSYGTSLFLFSYLLHRRGGRYGVFRLSLGWRWPFRLLFGHAGWMALCNHDVHHLNGKISPLHLMEARDLMRA
jgi:hypothetical protein